MKKLMILAVAIIFAMSPKMSVKAEEEQETIVETDVSVFEKPQLSVYAQNIRENIKGEWDDCECKVLCSCAGLYHVLEDTTQEDFYSAFFYGNHFSAPLGKVYQDCSISMEETFCYEKAKIIKNLSPFLNEKEKDIEDVFKKQKTNLYGLISSFKSENIGEQVIIMPEETPIIITDLWTVADEEKFICDGEFVFCVPYASTNKEGVLHCEDVINNLLWNHSWIPGSISIYVVYTDEVIFNYSNGYHNGDEGYIEIYVP